MENERLPQLQNELLSILLDVKTFCEEQNIAFYLGEGTLLGAARHQGFIPWDDDVDILMKREDYERFLLIAPSALGKKYVIQHPSTTDPYWSTFIKIRINDEHPLFFQKHIRHISPYCGPCIDVFPLDHVPCEDSVSQRIRYFQIRLFRRLIDYKFNLWPCSNLRRICLKAVSYLFPLKWLQKRTDRCMRGRNENPGKYIAAFSTYHKYESIVVPEEMYEIEQAIFEGHPMPIPAGYKTILTKIYGNWEAVPEKAERETKHQYDICPEHIK